MPESGAVAARTAPDVLYVVKDRASYPDITDGLRRLASQGVIRSQDCLEVRPGGTTARTSSYWTDIVNHVRDRRTEIVVFHHFHSDDLPDPRHTLQKIKELAHRPIVALTNGDAFSNGIFRPAFPRMFLQGVDEADVVFSSSMGRTADYLAHKSDRKIALLPHGACQVRFGMPPSPSQLNGKREFKAVFIGSNNRPRDPTRPYHWYAKRRERLVRLLSAAFGSEFAVFGRGWEGVPNWQGPLPFAEQQSACQRADLVVGGVPFSSARYYTSDRVFIQIASGVPFVDIAIEGVETILRDNEHWYLVPSLEEVVDRCDDLLCRPRAERMEAARAAANFVLAHHTIAARCRTVITELQRQRIALLEGGPPPTPVLDFFLPEVNHQRELSDASRGWLRTT
jgi:hypothetical protein